MRYLEAVTMDIKKLDTNCRPLRDKFRPVGLMKGITMRHVLLSLTACLILACGGGSSTPPPAPAPTPTPAPVAVPRGTYQATAHPAVASLAGAALSTAAPIGNVVQNMVVQNDGVCRMELDGWQHIHAVIFADAVGVLQLGSNSTLTNADGVTVPLTLTGTLVGNRMTGTTNGGAFDVTLTGIQDVPVDIATKAGTWISTASSNGQVMRLTIPAVLNSSYNITVEAYANSSDATAKVNSLGFYSGTLGWSDGDTAHVRNCFNIGFAWAPAGGSTLGGADSGLAYFDTTGNLIVLAAQPGDNGQTWNKQLSAVFVKE